MLPAWQCFRNFWIHYIKNGQLKKLPPKFNFLLHSQASCSSYLKFRNRSILTLNIMSPKGTLDLLFISNRCCPVISLRIFKRLFAIYFFITLRTSIKFMKELTITQLPPSKNVCKSILTKSILMNERYNHLFLLYWHFLLYVRHFLADDTCSYTWDKGRLNS